MNLDRCRRQALPALALLAGASLLIARGGSPVAAKPAKNRVLALRGIAGGRVSAAPTNADAGGLYIISASGKIAPMGHTAVSGSIRTPGFVSEGTPTGQLTLANVQGKVTLDLQGPVQPGFSPPPTQMQFTVVSGTGAFLHATGSGTLDLQWQTPKITLTFTPAGG